MIVLRLRMRRDSSARHSEHLELHHGVPTVFHVCEDPAKRTQRLNRSAPVQRISPAVHGHSCYTLLLPLLQNLRHLLFAELPSR